MRLICCKLLQICFFILMGVKDLRTLEIMLFAVGLSLDAFAVSICKGLSLENITVKQTGTVGMYFGAFQAFMPLAGYLIGREFCDQIAAFDHWVAFVLLLIVGARMIRESLQTGNRCKATLAVGEMLMLSVATSIDALAAGLTFALFGLYGLYIVPTCLVIGVTTFFFSVAGVYMGQYFGLKYKTPAEMLGGLILIGIGLKILIQHLAA